MNVLLLIHSYLCVITNLSDELLIPHVGAVVGVEFQREMEKFQRDGQGSLTGFLCTRNVRSLAFTRVASRTIGTLDEMRPGNSG